MSLMQCQKLHDILWGHLGESTIQCKIYVFCIVVMTPLNVPTKYLKWGKRQNWEMYSYEFK